MNAEERLSAIRECIESWSAKQGHDSCWYYPEVFQLVAKLAGANVGSPLLPPRCEFEIGCRRYQDEVYR